MDIDSKSIEEIIKKIPSEKLDNYEDGSLELAHQLSRWITVADSLVKDGYKLTSEDRAAISTIVTKEKPNLNLLYDETKDNIQNHSFFNSTEQPYKIVGNLDYIVTEGKGLEFVNINVKHGTDNPKPLDYMDFINTTKLKPKVITVLFGKNIVTVNMQDYKGDDSKENIDSYIITQAKSKIKKKISDDYQQFVESFKHGVDEGKRDEMIYNRIDKDDSARKELELLDDFRAVAMNYNDNDIAYMQTVSLGGSKMSNPNTATIQIKNSNENTPDKLYKLLQYAFKPVSPKVHSFF